MTSEEGKESDTAPYKMNILPNLKNHRKSGKLLKPTIKIIEEK